MPDPRDFFPYLSAMGGPLGPAIGAGLELGQAFGEVDPDASRYLKYNKGKTYFETPGIAPMDPGFRVPASSGAGIGLGALAQVPATIRSYGERSANALLDFFGGDSQGTKLPTPPPPGEETSVIRGSHREPQMPLMNPAMPSQARNALFMRHEGTTPVFSNFSTGGPEEQRYDPDARMMGPGGSEASAFGRRYKPLQGGGTFSSTDNPSFMTQQQPGLVGPPKLGRRDEFIEGLDTSNLEQINSAYDSMNPAEQRLAMERAHMLAPVLAQREAIRRPEREADVTMRMAQGGMSDEDWIQNKTAEIMSVQGEQINAQAREESKKDPAKAEALRLQQLQMLQYAAPIQARANLAQLKAAIAFQRASPNMSRELIDPYSELVRR